MHKRLIYPEFKLKLFKKYISSWKKLKFKEVSVVWCRSSFYVWWRKNWPGMFFLFQALNRVFESSVALLGFERGGRRRTEETLVWNVSCVWFFSSFECLVSLSLNILDCVEKTSQKASLCGTEGKQLVMQLKILQVIQKLWYSIMACPAWYFFEQYNIA